MAESGSAAAADKVQKTASGSNLFITSRPFTYSVSGCNEGDNKGGAAKKGSKAGAWGIAVHRVIN
jgi:hypothetical protein